MNNNIEEVESSLSQIKETNTIIKTGHAKPEELVKALKIAKESSDSFTGELYVRKAYKLLNPSSQFKNFAVISGFLSPNESVKLDPWIALFEEYLEVNK